MLQNVDAIFENGQFRPQSPVNIAEGQRVSLKIEPLPAPVDDVGDLLDSAFVDECRQQAASAPPLEVVRKLLSEISGSLADRISSERDAR